VLSYEEMDYEWPYPMTEVDPRTEIYCSRCGINSKWKPAEQLTVIRHHQPRHKDGHWMCTAGSTCRKPSGSRVARRQVSGALGRRAQDAGSPCQRCLGGVTTAIGRLMSEGSAADFCFGKV